MSETDYENVDVRIIPNKRMYRAEVRSASGSEAAPSTEFSSKSLLARLAEFLLHTSRGKDGSDGSEVTNSAIAYGRDLYEAVFQGDSRTELQTAISRAGTRGVRIRLRLANAPELSELPWEFLYDQGRKKFLALDDRTPVVRALDLPRVRAALEVTGPLRILVVMPSPSDRQKLDIEREWKSLESAVHGLVSEGRVEIVALGSAKFSDLPEQLQVGFHVIHFIGHGFFDRERKRGYLEFENEKGEADEISAVELGSLLGNYDSIRLVILNSCSGAQSSRGDVFNGTAQYLVASGIPSVLAMQFAVTDKAAITFASTFYRSLSRSGAVDASLSEARRQMFASGRNSVEWATPVLYASRDDGNLFDIRHLSTKEGGSATVTARDILVNFETKSFTYACTRASFKLLNRHNISIESRNYLFVVEVSLIIDGIEEFRQGVYLKSSLRKKLKVDGVDCTFVIEGFIVGDVKFLVGDQEVVTLSSRDILQITLDDLLQSRPAPSRARVQAWRRRWPPDGDDFDVERRQGTLAEHERPMTGDEAD